MTFLRGAHKSGVAARFEVLSPSTGWEIGGCGVPH